MPVLLKPVGKADMGQVGTYGQIWDACDSKAGSPYLLLGQGRVTGPRGLVVP